MTLETIDLGFQGVRHGIAAFLVRGPEGAILIECGPESTRDTLFARLEDLGTPVHELRALFVTHVHLDHAGAAGSIAAAGVPVYVHERGARHLVDPTRLVDSARGVYGDRFDALWGGMVASAPGQVHPLADGDTIAVAGLSVEAVETPGHAFHHHAYRIGGTLFAGDAAGARLPGSDFISVTSAPPQFHLEHSLASIDRLAALDPEALYLTHFGPVPDPQSHLAAYRDAVELNAEFVRQRLLEGFAGEALALAYEAFQLEQAYRLGMPPSLWPDLEKINAAAMCAEGLRMFWEGRQNEGKGRG